MADATRDLTPARDERPRSRHVGLIGGLGVGASVIYYRALAAACTARGVVPRLTLVHADAPTVLGHAGDGRLDELADYLSGFIAQLRDAGAELIAIPAVTPHVALPRLSPGDREGIVDLLEVTTAGLRDRGLSRVALFGTRVTIETRLFGALADLATADLTGEEINGIDRMYVELATAGRASEGLARSLRAIAHDVSRRADVDAVVLAGTDLRLVFDETTTDFPAFDCAAAHIGAILERAVGE